MSDGLLCPVPDSLVNKICKFSSKFIDRNQNVTINTTLTTYQIVIIEEYKLSVNLISNDDDDNRVIEPLRDWPFRCVFAPLRPNGFKLIVGSTKTCAHLYRPNSE